MDAQNFVTFCILFQFKQKKKIACITTGSITFKLNVLTHYTCIVSEGHSMLIQKEIRIGPCNLKSRKARIYSV